MQDFQRVLSMVPQKNPIFFLSPFLVAHAWFALVCMDRLAGFWLSSSMRANESQIVPDPCTFSAGDKTSFSLTDSWSLTLAVNRDICGPRCNQETVGHFACSAHVGWERHDPSNLSPALRGVCCHHYYQYLYDMLIFRFSTQLNGIGRSRLLVVSFDRNHFRERRTTHKRKATARRVIAHAFKYPMHG